MGAAPEKVAVVGAGLMGHGIAQVFACAGHPVSVYDPAPGALATVHERVAANLQRLGLSDEALACISVHEHLADALEGAASKTNAAQAPVGTIVASNTSSMPVAVYTP